MRRQLPAINNALAANAADGDGGANLSNAATATAATVE